jgi:hypothetical protein
VIQELQEEVQLSPQGSLVLVMYWSWMMRIRMNHHTAIKELLQFRNTKSLDAKTKISKIPTEGASN